MKSKIAIIILSVLLAICIAIITFIGVVYLKSPHCDSGDPFNVYDKTTWCDETPNIFNLPTKEDISKIKKNMPLEDAVAILGKPVCHVAFSSGLDYAWATRDGYVYFRLKRNPVYSENGEEFYAYYILRQMPAKSMDSLMAQYNKK